MNQEQFLGILRAVLAAAGGWAVGKGYIDSNTATAVGGAVVTIAMAAWSMYTNSDSQLIAQVNSSSVSGVKVVAETSPSLQVSAPINPTVK